MRSSLTSVITCLVLAGVFASGASHAQDAAQPVTTVNGDNQVVTYQASYFDQFQASTALDMVFHVPGFSFNGGDQVRGFAGAAGNVLIDGQRPASKSNLAGTLENISAAQVDHIELITGGAPGIDMQGYRQIVNVVRKAGGKDSVQIGGSIKTFYNDPKPSAFYTFSRNRDGKTTDIHLELFGFHDNGVNPTKRYVYTPDFSDPNPAFINIPQYGGGWGHEEKFSHSRPFLGGKLSFNGDYNPIDYDLNAAYDQDGEHNPEHLEVKEVSSELGMQYERPITKTLKMDVNLLRRHDREYDDDLLTWDTGDAHYSALNQTSEHIFSGKLTWQPTDKVTYKFGGESVFNRRDNTTRYTENGNDQNVPFDTVRVEEQRREYFAIRNWQPSQKLSIETGLKVETSTISVKQQNRSKSFVYPKPEVQIVWSPTDKMKWSWRTERVVGQLSFGDFASSVSLDTSVVKAGNPDLVPQKEWQNALSFDYSFWDKGAFNLTLKHSALEDTLDFAPIVTDQGVYNARVNLGAGTQDQIETNFTLPMDKFHIKGGELKVDYSRIFSSVTDPITHAKRQISNINPEFYTIVFSQNFPVHRTNWGFEIDRMNNFSQFNASDAYRYYSDDWLAIWFEYKTKSNFTVNVTVQNAFGRHDYYDRTVWQDLRQDSPLDHIEHNRSWQRPFLRINFKKEM